MNVRARDWWSAVARIVWPDAARGDVVEAAGRRAVNVFVLLGGGFGVVDSIVKFSEAADRPVAYWAYFAASVVALGAPWALAHAADFKRAVALTAIVGVALLGAMIVQSGHFLSNATITMPSLIATITLAVGVRIGAAAFAASAGLYAYLYVTEHMNWRRSDVELYATLDWLEACAALTFASLMIFAAAAVYRTQLERAATRLKASAEAAEAASRTKSEFLANMSHEIRTPLNGVLGTADLLRRADLAPREAAFADVIHRSGEALLAILNDILDFSKIEAGELELAHEPCDPVVAMEDVATLFKSTAENKGLALACAYDGPRPIAVTGDVGRYRQVLSNLVGNAVKFTESGDVRMRLDVETDDDDGARLNLAVADTGIGIPADKLTRIFDDFVQAEASTTRSFGGTGLGLAIVRRLVEAMDGDISVSSVPGEGSTFTATLRLPIAAAVETAREEGPQASARAPAAQKPYSERRVLLAEDNPVNQMIALAMLRASGLQATTANNGLEALDAFRARPFDLVLLDISMPEMDGLTAARKIREAEASTGRAPTPIIALTAHAFAEDRDRAWAAGRDDYLSKPIRQAELDRAIDKWLGASPPTRAASA
ncbi:MAG: ATP-binding protein [Parvularculaceae bacterium]